MRNLTAKMLCLGVCLARWIGTSAPAGTPLWTNRFDGPGRNNDQTFAIAAGSSGNVYVTGYSYGSNGPPDVDFATIAYSSAGATLWSRALNSPANSDDQAFAIDLDNAGNVFVAGYSSANIDLPMNRDWAIVKYSSAGAPIWTNIYGESEANEGATQLAVNSSGEVIVIGNVNDGTGPRFATIKYSNTGAALWTNYYESSGVSPVGLALDSAENLFVGGSRASSGGDLDFVLLAYSNAGVPLWTNRYGRGPDISDTLKAVKVDPSGNIFVIGYSGKTAFGGDDYVTIKYSNTGLPLWTNFYNGPGDSFDLASSAAVGNGGEVYVTGYSTGDGTSSDFATIGYSSAGLPLWTNRYNGPGNAGDDARAIAVDRAGNVFVTGASKGTNTDIDYATLAYTSSGAPLWTNRFHGTANGADYPSAIALDSEGNVFVTGTSSNGTNTDYVTIKYAGALAPARLNVVTVIPNLILTWTDTRFTLQSAPYSTGTFTTIPGATSPYTNPITGAQRFFRLISN